MNKTAIYVLSVLIIGVLGLSVIMPGVEMIDSFCTGFKAGYDASMAQETSEQAMTLPYRMNFNPTIDQILSSRDSIEFTDGRVYPIVIHQASVCVPYDEEMPVWATGVSVGAYLLSYILLIILIWKFVKFIINITREEIFVDVNSRYLRHFSYCLLAIAVLQITAGVIDEVMLSRINLSLAGYTLESSFVFPWGNLLIGLISLLISIIWAHAVLIKKEQELTI